MRVRVLKLELELILKKKTSVRFVMMLNVLSFSLDRVFIAKIREMERFAMHTRKQRDLYVIFV